MARAKDIRDAFREATEGKSRDELVEMVVELSARLVALEERVEGLARENERLTKENAVLKERLGLSSKNSHKPPSSDGPATPKDGGQKKRRKKGRKPGGQPGHDGNHRTLLPEEQVDRFEDVHPKDCNVCGGAVFGSDDAPQRHQVHDLPEEIRLTTVEYRLHALFCPDCRKTTRAELPEGVSWSPFGPRLQASVALLSVDYKQSDRKIRDFLQDFFGFEVSLGAVASMRKAVSEALVRPHNEALEHVQDQEIVHADETGWRVKAKRAWVWVATTFCVSLFLLRPRRSGEVAQELLGEDFLGYLVSDRWSSYKWVDKRRRQLCWAHLLREFLRIAGRGGSSGRLGRRLEKLGHDLFHEWHRYRRGELQWSSFRTYAGEIRREVRACLDRGSRCRQEKTAATCRDLLECETMMWTFTRVEGLEPTNNAAERALRPAVIRRKLSFGTQSDWGSRFVERMLTVSTTLRQQGRDVLGYLTEACRARQHQQDAPSILPAAA